MSEGTLWANPYSLLITDPTGRTIEASFGISEEDTPIVMLTVWSGDPKEENSASILTIHMSANSLMEILKEGWEFGEEPPEHWDELCKHDDEGFEDGSDGSTH